MIESRRRAYLEAMGLDVWTMKPASPSFDRLVIQPGKGGTLLLCEQPEETVSRLGGDLARALGQDVVWAWPDPEGSPENTSLEQAIGHHLFTRVIIFGGSLAVRVCRGNAPEALGSARILVTGAVGELEVRGNAKQALWEQLSVTRFN